MAIINPDEKQFEHLLAELVEIYDSAYQEEPQRSYRSPYPTGQYLRWLYDGDPHGFFVALEDDKPVGFVSIHSNWHERSGGHVGELHEIAVRPDWGRKGIGTALIHQAEQFARQQGRETATLWVGEHNTRAAELYRKLGFQCVRHAGVWMRMQKHFTSEL